MPTGNDVIHQPSRFPKGVSTSEDGIGYFLPLVDPTKFVNYYEDFLSYVAGNWTVTTVGAGAARAITNVAGGWLLITNDAADNDLTSMQLVGEAFKLVSGKRTFFEVKFTTSEATQIDLLFGLVITDTSPLAHTDGIVFRKDDGDTNIDFASVKNSAGTTSDAVATLAAATTTVLSFYFDGTDITLYKDRAAIKRLYAITFCDDEELTPTFHVQNGDAVVRTLTIDYIYASQER